MWRLSDLLGADPYPGSQPETEARNESTRPRPDYTVAPSKAPEHFYWVATPLHVLVGAEEPQAMLSQMNVSESTPHATGALSLAYRWDAAWELKSGNMALSEVTKALREYTKQQGWNFVGLVQPSGDFYKTAEYPGIGEILPGVKDWRNKEWSGMELHNNPGRNMNEGFPYSGADPDEDPQTNLAETYTCSECGYPASDYADWRGHIVREHVRHGEPPKEPQYIGPPPDLDDALPANWNEGLMDQTAQRAAGWHLADVQQDPQVPGPIPFIYDIDQDRIYVGHPGERHSDIQGRFTPGGIVEGTYDPKGMIQLRTDTDMPYTVKHLGQLWYAMHPELEIKNIYLIRGPEQYKLAGPNIGHKVRNLLATDPAAYEAFRALSRFGTVYAVGGAVRDIVLNKPPKDIDLMVSGVPAEDVQSILESLPGKVDYTGKQFGVFRYRDPDGYEVEIALPRKEHSTGEGHKDFDVSSDPFMSVEEDLARRDFTGNAMAVNLSSGELIDPYDGSLDLKAGQLKTVSDRAFKEDPLRILRVLTSIARHHLIPTRQVLEEIQANAYLVDHLPAERIQAELDKMLQGEDPALAISLLEETGLFRYILPEYEKTRGFNQRNPHHYEELHDHLKSVLQRTADQTEDPDVRWAALLHDIGKPESAWLDPDGEGHYYHNRETGQGKDHWAVGAQMAKSALGRLKFPNDRIDRITHLIQHHMFPEFSTERGARKFLNRVGDDHADDLISLRRADKARPYGETQDVDWMQRMVADVRSKGQPVNIKDLAITGRDLIDAGFQPGPQMGDVLRYLTQQVIENPELNEPNTLVQMAEGVWDNTRQANILDPIQQSLDPDVFKNGTAPNPMVKPGLISWVKNKVYQTMTDAGWPDPRNYLSLVLTGSLTTYQWAAHSDFDMSLWIDTEHLPEFVRADLIRLMIEKCDGTIVPGTSHPLQCFVVNPAKTARADIYQPGLRSAYDLETRTWIVPPEHREVDVNIVYHASLIWAQSVVDKLKLMLRYGNDGAVQVMWDSLHRRRFKDMQAGKGDFADSNIVYKLLSNEGLFPAISEATGEYIG